MLAAGPYWMHILQWMGSMFINGISNPLIVVSDGKNIRRHASCVFVVPIRPTILSALSAVLYSPFLIRYFSLKLRLPISFSMQ